MNYLKTPPEVIIKNLKRGKHNLVMSLPLPLVLELRDAMFLNNGKEEYKMWGEMWNPEKTLTQCNLRLKMGY